jgi:hypothetical protein
MTNYEELKEGTGGVANIRYGHLEVPWDAPLSLGVQSFIEYNGLIINNRYQSDLVRAVGITGLSDAEFSDVREPRPSAHGEFVYDSFYRGRNLVLTGFFETSTLGVLKYYERQLQAAFAPLTESYLKFRWFDIYDSFDEAQTIYPYSLLSPGPSSGNYSPFKGSISNLKIENSQLRWVSPGENYVLRTAEKRTYCDVQITMSAVVGSVNNSYFCLICSAKNENEYLRYMYNHNSGNPHLLIQTVIEGAARNIEEIPLPEGLCPMIGQKFWLRGRKEGNYVTIEFWNKLPESNTLPSFYLTANLVGTDAEIFGDKVMGQVGFGGNQLDTLWRFDDFKIESIYPGDVAFKVKKTSELAIKDEQTNLSKFKRAYQITLKTSDFRAFASTQSRKTLIPSINLAGAILGRKYKRSYPLKYKLYIPSSITLEERIINVNNRGTVFVEPILVINGPFKNIQISSLTNGMSLVWTGSIKEGDYLKFDCKEKTLVNSLGENKKETLSTTLQWMKLEPMWNDLYLLGSEFSASTVFSVYHKHGFMG